ncbi:MAG: hypothetical protein AB7T38_05500 [Nitrospirales bacterium]
MDENNGFRRALRNPILVAGLCLIAGVAMYVNYTDTLTSEFVSPLDPLSFPPTGTSLEKTSSPSLGSPEPSAAMWNGPSLRDPFSPVGMTSPSLTHSSSSNDLSIIPEPRVPSFPQMALKAIAVEDDVKSAVINRSVVYEGDTVEGFQVLSIESNGVWLGQGRDKHFLTFAERKVS